MKQKGFTLIELLAVIVILAVIALIATPLIMNTINEAKRGAAISSAYNYIHAVETAMEVAMIKDTSAHFVDGVFTSSNNTYVVETAQAGQTATSVVLAPSYKGTTVSAALSVSQGVINGGNLLIDGFTLVVDASGSVSATN